MYKSATIAISLTFAIAGTAIADNTVKTDKKTDCTIHLTETVSNYSVFFMTSTALHIKNIEPIACVKKASALIHKTYNEARVVTIKGNTQKIFDCSTVRNKNQSNIICKNIPNPKITLN